MVLELFATLDKELEVKVVIEGVDSVFFVKVQFYQVSAIEISLVFHLGRIVGRSVRGSERLVYVEDRKLLV